jgi:hypothetical protein
MARPTLYVTGVLTVALTTAAFAVEFFSSNPATVCALADHPVNYRDSFVSVTGRIESDGLESVLIVDDKCPTVGFPLRYSEQFNGSAEAGIIEKNLPPAPIGTSFVDIRGVFIGRVGFKPKQDAAHPCFVLVDDVSELKIEHLRKKRHSPFPGL